MRGSIFFVTLDAFSGGRPPFMDPVFEASLKATIGSNFLFINFFTFLKVVSLFLTAFHNFFLQLLHICQQLFAILPTAVCDFFWQLFLIFLKVFTIFLTAVREFFDTCSWIFLQLFSNSLTAVCEFFDSFKKNREQLLKKLQKAVENCDH